MRRDAHVKRWQRLRVERRRRAMVRLWRLRAERKTRAAGTFHGTRATAYGDVQSGPQRHDPGRALLALLLLTPIVAGSIVGLATAGQHVVPRIPPVPPARQHAVTVIVCVRPNESMAALSGVLQRKGLIADARVFYWYWYLRPSAVHGGLQVASGPHPLHTGMGLEALAQALQRPPAPAAPRAC